MSDTRDLTVGEISDMLRGSAEAVARDLLPGGRVVGGREWHCRGSESPCGEAISVHIGSGAKQGVVGFWNSSRKGGDLIDLAEIVLGTNKAGAVAWAKEFLGLPTDTRAPVDHEKIERRRRQIEAARKYRALREEAERHNKLEYAAEIWRECKTEGIGYDYLKSRGLHLYYVDRTVLRCHPSLPHSEGGSYPALVAKITNERAGFSGIWRIYVARDGGGKAPVESPKRGLGVAKGGAVRVGGLDYTIGIAEGIETALAVRQLIAEQTSKLIPVWPALSANGVEAVDIPTAIRAVKIFADSDAIKFRKGAPPLPSVGLHSAEMLRQRLEYEGVDATVNAPPTVSMDWLDVLNAEHALVRQ